MKSDREGVVSSFHTLLISFTTYFKTSLIDIHSGNGAAGLDGSVGKFINITAVNQSYP